jgi:hypothetical protein
LNVDVVEAEPIFLDDAINAAVTTAPDSLSSVFQRATIAYRNQKFHHEALEKGRQLWKSGTDMWAILRDAYFCT